MKELIKIEQQNLDGNQVKTVNARDLHEFLEVGKDFSTWLKDRIDKYDFLENQDYVCSPVLVSKGRGGHNAIDYHLSLDMAKELSMVERNAKGKEARQYFIECEKIALAPKQQHYIPQNLPDALRLAADLAEKNEALQLQITNDRPKVIFADSVSSSEGTILIGELAKILKQNGIDIGQKRLFEWLRVNGYLIKRVGMDRNMPTQYSMELGLFEIKERTSIDPSGKVFLHKTTVVTGKGQQYFIKKFLAEKEVVK